MKQLANNIILCDIDGCLLNWLDSFIDYMKTQWGYTWNHELGEPHQYDMAPHFGITHDEVVIHITNFNVGFWQFGALKPTDGAQDAMIKLSDMGYRFVAISSCSTDNRTVALRKANLYNHFGDIFDDVHCIDIHENKKSYLTKHQPTFWIEDNFNNCVDGLQYGHNCILVNRNWNENDHHDEITRFDEWSQIVDFIGENKNFNKVRT